MYDGGTTPLENAPTPPSRVQYGLSLFLFRNEARVQRVTVNKLQHLSQVLSAVRAVDLGQVNRQQFSEVCAGRENTVL